jgi:tRNA(Arg) A34 adenosine deaminase TadA
MAIVWHYWCGNKRGRRGEYPWNPKPTENDPEHLDGDYRGHNIAALGVDGDGRVLDFDFNHNELFRSSAEHAEARLVRRLYSLAQVSESWTSPVAASHAVGSRTPAGYISLEQVTIYTSLESCAQCAGVMALAQVKEVVYLQTDPGMYFIGRILRNVTPDSLRAPLPIGGGELELPEFQELDAGYEGFSKLLAEAPFWRGPGGQEDRSPSLTSFLCTAQARDIFAEGRQRMMLIRERPELLQHPTFRPGPSALDNRAVVDEIGSFVDYATTLGFRATPHNL